MEEIRTDVVIDAIEGWTYEEWCRVRDRVEEEFEQLRKQVTFSERSAWSVKRILALEEGRPIPEESKSAQQTRMGF